jgi:putative DNA primase/helicase
MQQWFGYCLTGDTREHALAVLYGPGGNGKSVCINTLVAILGDYAVTSSMETFTASRFDRHSTDLAMLRGARLVTATETEDGRAWAEARIKQLTGGDLITARFMRQDNFTFRPEFKLMIAGNHAPSLRNVDDAMRRRLLIAPFTARPKAPDPHLETKLRAEHGMILNWAIEGCLSWQLVGLSRPKIITAATDDYFADQDLLAQWLDEWCDQGERRSERPSDLYQSWMRFSRAAGEEPGTLKSFVSELQRRGFEPGKANGVRVYRGVSLRIRGDDE